MSRPATRLLTVLELLQSHGRLSGPVLAERVGVDPRTLRRYVAQLEEMGIPIEVERGCLGGYGLVPGYKLPPLMFSDEEALAVAVGLRAARGLGLSDAAPGVVSAQAKLERVLPAALRGRVRAVHETVALDLPPAARLAPAGTLSVLAEAARERRTVQMRYLSAQDKPSERAFDPYGLAFRGGCWYAVGHCHLRGGLRSFRADRIRAATATTRSFRRPESFDALAWIAESIARLPRAHAIEVLVQAELEAVRRAVPASIAVLERVPGGVLLFAQTDDLAWFARELARLPFAFEIRVPNELRARLVEHLETLSARLRRPHDPKPRRPRRAARAARRRR